MTWNVFRNEIETGTLRPLPLTQLSNTYAGGFRVWLDREYPRNLRGHLDDQGVHFKNDNYPLPERAVWVRELNDCTQQQNVVPAVTPHCLRARIDAYQPDFRRV